MRRTLAKAFLGFFILASAAGALSACRSVQGAGEDITNTGRAVERAF